jgi:hypothetical protein
MDQAQSTWRGVAAQGVAHTLLASSRQVFPKRSKAGERIERGRLGEAFQLVRSERQDKRRIEQLREPLRHQQRLAGDTADALQSAHQIDVWPDQREIESVAVADVAVAYFTVMERNAGAKLGIEGRELLQALERA